MAEAISDYDRAAGRLDPAEAGASATDSREPEPPPARVPLGSLLTGSGFISEAQLAEGLAEGAATGARLGEVVVRRGWATEDDIAKLLAEQWQLGYVDRASIFFDAEALARLSREEAQRLEALPTRVQDGHVVVAVAEPTEQRLTALRAVIGDDTVVVVVPKTALDAGLRSDLLSGSKSGDDDVRAAVEVRSAELRVDDVVQAPAPPAPEAAAGNLTEAASSAPSPAPADSGGQPELRSILVALEAAARDATTLELNVSELGRRLAGIVDDVAAAAARLEQSGQGEGESQARIRSLEAELAQRTEMTEGLKAQLVGLTRTLENYR